MSTDTPEGDRIAKVLSRAGVASRREAERMIDEGRVKVNGKVIDSPALNVTAKDRITVDDKPVAEPEPPRVWLYHKPAGLVTTERDELDRPTVFGALPEDMPRVMSVGRLDLNSEGLLLLTNDGELKRQLELPATGWLRRYRVRVKGSSETLDLDKLRAGIEVEGIKYAPMMVQFDRQQGANAWLTIAIREGKNREIRRAMEAIGAIVNRLIRISYGPFQLGNLAAGEVEEIKRRVLRDQLGWDADLQPTDTPKAKPTRTRKVKEGTSTARPAPRAGDKPAGRTGGKTFFRSEGDSAKPATRSVGRFDAKRDGKPDNRKPESRSDSRSDNRGDKPFGKSPRKSGEKTIDKPFDKGGDRFGAKLGDRPAGKTFKSSGKSAGPRAASRPDARPSGRTGGRPTGKPPKK